jgi:hypothetical protein
MANRQIIVNQVTEGLGVMQSVSSDHVSHFLRSLIEAAQAELAAYETWQNARLLATTLVARALAEAFPCSRKDDR